MNEIHPERRKMKMLAVCCSRGEEKGVSQGIGVIEANWNRTHKHSLSLADKHCKQMKTAQAGFWRARGFSSEVCLPVSPVLREVAPGSEVGWTRNTLCQWRAECLFGLVSFVSKSHIIANQHRFIRKKNMYG